MNAASMEVMESRSFGNGNNTSVHTPGSITIKCERCGRYEIVDFPENLFDFRYKYGLDFCEDCIIFWVNPDNELVGLRDRFEERMNKQLEALRR